MVGRQGMLFLLLSCLLIASSIATLFYWNIQNSSLVKVSYRFDDFKLERIMFLQANNYCDAYGQQFGCFQYYYSSNSYKVAAAFSFIAIIFAALDIVLNFLFYFFDERYRIGQGDPKDAKSKYRVPSTEPQISVIGSAE
ncbi:hypothetical protein WR25_01151 [Diploscapter pachys]|uniref:MARVEL domain-containing protein n=1 Tax=Diploscapter pachys TaxID=2018661 RepID=A0A2A2KBH9_9BILA|nr:hypothetical protein WR25_01151 [Diploscapter pachys]